MNRTLIICKPDAVERNLVGEILRRFEAKGLSLAAAELRTIDVATSRQHYAEHVEKPFYGELEEFITRGPSPLWPWTRRTAARNIEVWLRAVALLVTKRARTARKNAPADRLLSSVWSSVGL